MSTTTEPHGALISLEGEQEFVDLGHQALDAVQVPIEELLAKPITIRYVDQIAKPAPTWAKGYWRGGPRRADIRTLRRSDKQPKRSMIRYLTLHEALGHGSDEDVLSGKRAAICAIMVPVAKNWADVAGKKGMDAYWHLPSEAYANRMVEAITDGKVRSPYDDDYTRTIPDARLGSLLTIVRSTITPTPPVEPPPTAIPEPPPTDIDALRVAFDAAQAQVDAALEEYAALLDLA